MLQFKLPGKVKHFIYLYQLYEEFSIILLHFTSFYNTILFLHTYQVLWQQWKFHQVAKKKYDISLVIQESFKLQITVVILLTKFAELNKKETVSNNASYRDVLHSPLFFGKPRGKLLQKKNINYFFKLNF